MIPHHHQLPGCECCDPAVPSTAGGDPLAEYVALEKERRALDARLKANKEAARKLEAEILDEWADRGQTNAAVDGLTVYLATDFYCTKRGGVEREVLCDALAAAGRPDLVHPDYSASALKAWVKELLAESGEVPGELAPLLNVQEAPRLRTRVS